MWSTLFTVGVLIGSAFVNTLVEKATSYILQKLGKRSDLPKEVRQSDLSNEVSQLSSSLLRANAVFRIAERKQQRNKDDEEQLQELLLPLKHAAHAVKDLFDDLDNYYLLHGKIAEANEASQNIPSSSSFAASSSNSGDHDFAAKARGVRERLDAVLNDLRNLTANLEESGRHHEMPSRKRELSSLPIEPRIIGRDKHPRVQIAAELKGEESGRQHEMPPRKRESISLPAVPRMIGRDKEKEDLIRLLLSTAEVSGSSTADRSISVLPVVGMGGVGKTTLAQFVYQDTRVRNYFQLKKWVCVSNVPFDVKRLTRMILESPAEKELSNLSSLQEHLKEKVSSKRYLLVLDDVWNEDRKEWESLLAPLRYGLQGSMIMVTTRSEKVVRAMTGALDPIFLKGLPEDDYMEFFKACAFGSENPKDHPEMEEIAERIAAKLKGSPLAAKLKGSPLAAKTLGGSLNSNMDVRHWRNIMNSEIRQLQQDENDIMSSAILNFMR